MDDQFIVVRGVGFYERRIINAIPVLALKVCDRCEQLINSSFAMASVVMDSDRWCKI